jgi:hypothetical protein
MTNQKSISRLSLVVIALLAAAGSCLAQTKSTQARQATEIATLRNERLNIFKSESKTSAKDQIAEQASASRIKFEQSIERATADAPSLATTLSESDWQKTRTVISDESSSPKRITFVPSRGQKLPE